MLFGRIVLRDLVRPDPASSSWRVGPYLGTLAVVSGLGAGVAATALAMTSASLSAARPDVVPVTLWVLGATVLRALLIGLSTVCVARRQWRTWVLADATGLFVVLLGCAVVLTTGGGVVAVVVVSAVGNAAGLIVRAVPQFTPVDGERPVGLGSSSTTPTTPPAPAPAPERTPS